MGGPTPWAWRWPIRETRLTGRVRTRMQAWTGLLIYQVEEERQHFHFLTDEPGIKTLRWRDARYGDVAQTTPADFEAAWREYQCER